MLISREEIHALLLGSLQCLSERRSWVQPANESTECECLASWTRSSGWVQPALKTAPRHTNIKLAQMHRHVQYKVLKNLPCAASHLLESGNDRSVCVAFETAMPSISRLINKMIRLAVKWPCEVSFGAVEVTPNAYRSKFPSLVTNTTLQDMLHPEREFSREKYGLLE